MLSELIIMVKPLGVSPLVQGQDKGSTVGSVVEWQLQPLSSSC